MNIPLTNLGNTNFKVRRQKFGIGSLIYLLLFGAAFTAAGLYFYKSTQIDTSWNRVQGSVVDVSSRISDGSTTYTPVIRYTVNNRSYQVTSSSGSSSYPTIGDEREVAYNPTRPDQAKAVEGTGSKMLVLIFPAVGIAILILAPFLFIRSLQRSNRIKNLMQTGQKLQGILVDLQSPGGSNNSTYKIVVSATDNSGTVQNYTSDSLNGIAGLAMADFRNNPIPIDVYVDPTNPQNYFVDISDIPNLTPQRIGELIKSAVSNAQPSTFNHGQVPPQTTEPLTPPNNPPFPPQA